MSNVPPILRSGKRICLVSISKAWITEFTQQSYNTPMSEIIVLENHISSVSTAFIRHITGKLVYSWNQSVKSQQQQNMLPTKLKEQLEKCYSIILAMYEVIKEYSCLGFLDNKSKTNTPQGRASPYYLQATCMMLPWAFSHNHMGSV